ncbi:MAG: ATP-binding protein [Bacillota bacterium]|nr:ATP-binding protein [Bacillota bacterium]
MQATEITSSNSLLVCELSKKYEFLFEYARDIILFIEENGQIRETNRAAEHAYGYTQKELLTMNISDLRGPNSLEDVTAQTNTAQTQNSIFETWHSRKDGSIFPVEVSSHGEMLGGKVVLLYIIRDLSERKHIEHGLTRRNTELSLALDKLKLAQVQLLQQDKLAAIGQLAAGVAHEINNPLAYIDSNMRSLQRYMTTMQQVLNEYRKAGELGIGQAEPPVIDYILEDMPKIFAECREGIERVSEIVKGLKLFSRIDSLQEIDDYDLNVGIKTTLLVAKNELKYVADVIERLGDIPTIRANGGQINQVILNILLNSAQAITEAERGDGGIIEIATASDGAFVSLDISDNGTGIPPEHYSKIFDPFFTTKPPGKGTGLGLSISYDIIVNKHKGQISVVSFPDRGTTFRIVLPVDCLLLSQ